MLGPLVENSFMLPPSNKVIYQNNLFLLYHDNQVALAKNSVQVFEFVIGL